MTLKEAGLVRELAGGYWQRIGPKAKSTAVAAPLTSIEEVTVATPDAIDELMTRVEKLNPFERLDMMANTLREAADEIDRAALQMQEQIDSASAGSGKLLQLKELLKSI